jgi:hypothetical protein
MEGAGVKLGDDVSIMVSSTSCQQYRLAAVQSLACHINLRVAPGTWLPHDQQHLMQAP